MKKFLISAAVLLATLSSCMKESIETTYANQDSKIGAYVEKELSSHPEYSVTNNGGATRLTVVQGSGEALKSNGVISFYYAGYKFTGSGVSSGNLFATNHKETADNARWELSDSTSTNILTTGLSEAGFVKGLEDGLKGVKGGEECYIFFSGKYGYGKKAVGTIPANCALVYHVWVESISNE